MKSLSVCRGNFLLLFICHFYQVIKIHLCWIQLQQQFSQCNCLSLWNIYSFSFHFINSVFFFFLFAHFLDVAGAIFFLSWIWGNVMFVCRKNVCIETQNTSNECVQVFRYENDNVSFNLFSYSSTSDEHKWWNKIWYNLQQMIYSHNFTSQCCTQQK